MSVSTSTDLPPPIVQPEAQRPASAAVASGFTVLCQSLAQHAIEATDRDDDAEFQRALSYRATLRRMAERWASGERSPTRTAPAKAEG